MNNRGIFFIAMAMMLVVAIFFVTSTMFAQVASHQKISSTQGGFTGALDPGDEFGWAPANIGDLDGDGNSDIAVGTPFDDDGGSGRGAVWVLFLNSDGTVKASQKISSTQGNFTGHLDDGDDFGHSVAGLGDYDQDGIEDIAVGALLDDDGSTNTGAIWLLFLNTNGTVKAYQKISSTQGGFTGVINGNDGFGHGLARLGDLDGDGVDDLAAATGHLAEQGVIWVLFMNSDHTVRDYQRISQGEGGFSGDLDLDAELGHDMDALGDFDGDGVLDLVAGIRHDDDGGEDQGAIFLIFLNPDGTVKANQKISATAGGFTGDLDSGDVFGHPPVNAGDLDGDGVTDLFVGAVFDDDGGGDTGAVWILYLNSDGTVKTHEKISPTFGGFTGSLDPGDLFGHVLTNIGDLNGDGATDIAVGTPRDDDGGSDKGAVWILFLDHGTEPQPGADLAVDKSDSTDPVIEGDALTYTVIVANNGSELAENVTLTDNLPSGVSYISASPDQGSCSQVAGLITCNLGDIANGNSIGVTIDVNTIVSGLLTNSVGVSSDTDDPNTANNNDDENTTVLSEPVPGADLAVSKTDTEDPVIEGDNVTYKLVVSNSGPGSAENVILTDNLPGGVDYISATPDQEGTCSELGGAITCNLGEINNEGSVTVTIVVNTTIGGLLINSVSVSSDTDDPNTANNNDDEDTTVLSEPVPGADLTVSKTDTEDPVTEGDNVTYTVAVSNSGPDTAENVILTDSLPEGVIYISATPNQGSCNEAGGMVTCILGDIAIDDNVSVTIVVKTTIGGMLTNAASVSSDTDDPNTANNNGVEETTVAGIKVTPFSGLVTSEEGDTDTFTVVLTSQPSANVTINLSCSDTSEGTVSPGSLTFTPSNWHTSKTVTATGMDDAVDDGSITYKIIPAPAISDDPNYSGIKAADVSVTNLDDDEPLFIIFLPSIHSH